MSTRVILPALVALLLTPVASAIQQKKQNKPVSKRTVKTQLESATTTLLEDEDCARVVGVARETLQGGEAAYIEGTRALRQAVLEATGPRHRARARRALIKILLGHLRNHVETQCDQARFPLAHAEVDGNTTAHAPDAKALAAQAQQSSSLPRRLAALYDLAEAGGAGVPTLLAALQGSPRNNEPAVRLLAANSLPLTGVEPTKALLAALNTRLDHEPDRAVRFEETLALAAFAGRSKDALASFRKRLLSERDCDFAQATALSLPSHDLRLVLYKRLAHEQSARAVQIRRWVRATRFRPCRRVTAPGQG